jgi:hypothetical protein
MSAEVGGRVLVIGLPGLRPRKFGRIARLPAGQRVDRVDVDEAVAIPERARCLVGAVAGRAVQGLGLHEADAGGCQGVQGLAEQRGAVPAAAAGGVDGDPQDFRPGG